MNTHIQTGHIAANGDINIGNQTVINLYHSANWQELQKREQELRKNIAAFETIAPSNENIQSCLREAYQNLQTVLQQQQDLKRDVLKLAEDFQRIELNTERLQQAYAYFQQGEFDKARAVLDTEAMQSEQTRLLEQKDKLARQTTENEKALAHNAQEWLLKARLIAIDYSLKEQRIPQARAAFETALKSERSANNLFEYALFLQENNQDDDAINYYEEALNQYCKLAQQQPKVFESYVTGTLNNLAILLGRTQHHRENAEQYHRKALNIRRKLAQFQPKFKKDVAQSLNNLAILLAQNQSSHSDAEACFNEALFICRELAKQQPEIFEQYIANTLNNLALLLSNNPPRRSDAEAYYREALALCRKLAQLQPNIYQPKVATTLFNFALLYYGWDKPAATRPLAEEAAVLIAPYAERYPQYFGGLQQNIQNLLNKLH